MSFIDHRFKTDKFKTFHDVFDQFTEKNLFKLITQGAFEVLESAIDIGKEANIFTAVRKDGSRIVIKIYRLSTCDFNKMYQYIRQDPRFTGVKRKRRDTIFAWAQREYANLDRARKGGVRVPTPFGVIKNILLMEFIGNDDPAQKLKNKPPRNPHAFYQEVVDNYRKLWTAGIVHGDLSPFNILNLDERPVFIDMSQSTVLEDREAENYLKRDARNLVLFFTKLGVKTSQEEFMKLVRAP